MFLRANTLPIFSWDLARGASILMVIIAGGLAYTNTQKDRKIKMAEIKAKDAQRKARKHADRLNVERHLEEERSKAKIELVKAKNLQRELEDIREKTCTRT